MKRFTFILAFCASFALLNAQDRIMLIADPHVTPQSVIDAEPDFDSYMTKQRKMLDLSQPIWDALVDTALAYHPSLILIPGDLTRDGEPEAHAYVSASLLRLRQAGIPSLVIPGNHDLPNTVDWESLYPVEGESVARDAASKSYAVNPLRGLTVIGIDGSNGTAGTGVISPSTMRFVLSQADEAREKGHTVIAMAHWQILEHFDQQSTLEPACRFKSADAIRDSLMAHGVHLVLTGHFHVNGITTFRDTTALSKDSLVEITTGAPITFPCPYRWLTLSPDRASISVTTDYLTALPSIADLYSYSRDWMAEHTENLIPSLALKAWGKVDSMWDSKIVPNLKALGFDDILINLIKKTLPQTNEERIAITKRNIGTPAINLYLFHSEANESDYPQKAQALAEDVYTGMQNMVKEALGLYAIAFGETFAGMAVLMAQEPVQSLVEDRTLRKSRFSDLTDDLHLTLSINTPQLPDALESLNPNPSGASIKYLHNGQLIIRRNNGKTYNAQGIQLK